MSDRLADPPCLNFSRRVFEVGSYQLGTAAADSCSRLKHFVHPHPPPPPGLLNAEFCSQSVQAKRNSQNGSLYSGTCSYIPWHHFRLILSPLTSEKNAKCNEALLAAPISFISLPLGSIGGVALHLQSCCACPWSGTSLEIFIQCLRAEKQFGLLNFVGDGDDPGNRLRT